MSSGAVNSSYSISPLLPGRTPSVKPGGEDLLSLSETRSSQSQMGPLRSFIAVFANAQLPTPTSQPSAALNISKQSSTQSSSTTPSNQTAATYGAKLTSSSARNVGAQGVIQTPFGLLPAAQPVSVTVAQQGQETRNGSFAFAPDSGANVTAAQRQGLETGLFGLNTAAILAESATAGSAPASTQISFLRRA